MSPQLYITKISYTLKYQFLQILIACLKTVPINRYLTIYTQTAHTCKYVDQGDT